MAVSRQIGSHFVEIGGDLLYMKMRGETTPEQVEKILALIEESFGVRPYYAVLDYTEMGSVDRAVRKRVAAWSVSRNCRGAAIYGASVTLRALTVLVQSAVRLLSKKHVPLVFVKNHEQALACITELRERDQEQSRAS